MFGYIRPLECELKVREQAEYRGIYCGLCKSIGRRYGQLERLTLSYDCAFLALTLMAINGDAKFTRGNCGPRIYRGKRPIADASPTLDYAADVNVLLAWYKAADDADDEKSAKAAAARVALMRAAVILNAPTLPASEKAAAQWMYYNLGKWIYLIDAWDDRKKDEEKKSYNPFLLSGMGREQAEFLLNITLNEAKKAYDLLSLKAPGGVLENIMILGLVHTQERVLAEKEVCAAENNAPQRDEGDKE